MARPTHLPVEIAGVTLRNPIIAAAGTCGYVREFEDVLPPAHLGALVTKSITREPREGNPAWRIIDARHGMLNAIGLANVGLDRFLAEKLPGASEVDTVVIGSIAGNAIEDYVAVAAAFDDAPSVPLVELNVSCPNTADGLQFGEHPEALRALLADVRPALAGTKLIVKLSPNVSNIAAMAETAVASGADALTLINTVSALAIDVHTRQPRLSRGKGGLSGPAIHPIAVRMVNEVYEAVARDAGIPIIGLGGVMRWQDAAELVLAGASAVGMGTALFVDPKRPVKVARGLARWVREQGCGSLDELVGKVEM